MPDGSIEFGGVQPEMKNFLAQLAEWYAEGLINPEFATRDAYPDYMALEEFSAFIDDDMVHMPHSYKVNDILGEYEQFDMVQEAIWKLDGDGSHITNIQGLNKFRLIMQFLDTGDNSGGGVGAYNQLGAQRSAYTLSKPFVDNNWFGDICIHDDFQRRVDPYLFGSFKSWSAQYDVGISSAFGYAGIQYVNTYELPASATRGTRRGCVNRWRKSFANSFINNFAYI